MVYEDIKTSPDLIGVVRTHSPEAYIFRDFTLWNGENWLCWAWGGSQGPFLVFWGRFLFKVSHNMPNWWCHRVESVFFLSRSCQEPLDLLLCQEVPDREKIVRLHSRDLGPAPKEPGQVWNAGLMCHTWGLARLPADLHGGQRGGHHGDALHVGQQGGVLDPKCGTSILLFILDRVLLVQFPGL